jgi:LacI family transcriptional regulator
LKRPLYTSLITRAVRLGTHFNDVPTILVNCHERKRDHISVVPGDVAGAYAATEALLKAGHRKIAYLAGEDWIEASRDREKGYRQAMATWDVAVDPDLIIRGAWTVDGGRRMTLSMLERPAPPSALFCFNDRMAAGAYDAARIKGLEIPRDISIVGFDDEETSAYLNPPLTTVKLAHDDMARWAVERLLVGGVDASELQRPRQIKIECPLVVRHSVAKRAPSRTPARVDETE